MALRALCLKLYPSSCLPYPITKDGWRIDEAWIQKRVNKLAAGGALLVIGSAVGVRKASSYWRWIIPAGVAVMGGLTCLFWSYFDRWIAKRVIIQHLQALSNKFMREDKLDDQTLKKIFECEPFLHELATKDVYIEALKGEKGENLLSFFNDQQTRFSSLNATGSKISALIKKIEALQEQVKQNQMTPREQATERSEDLTMSQALEKLRSPQEKHLAEEVLGQKLRLFTCKEQWKQNFPKLQKEFSLVKNDAEKFHLLAGIFVLTQQSRPIAKTCQFLETLEWPSEELKKKELPVLIVILLEEKKFVSWQETSINFKDQKLSTYKAVLDMRKIFGCRDFTEKPQQMSRYIVEAIRLQLNLLGEWTLMQLKKNRAEAIGLYVEICQFMECRFPASMVSPLLPCLAEIPGLVGLNLNDIGTERPREKKTKASGFGDEDADALLKIIRQQPFLQDIKINLEAMSEGKQKQILAEMEKPPSNDVVQRLLELADKLEDEQSEMEKPRSSDLEQGFLEAADKLEDKQS